jgi:outer membrane protein assembly factor BamD (BamD/ComL family)
LFARAGSLRREGNATAALLVYRQLERSYPNSPEAQLSEALVGRLLLDRGATADAIAAFDRYLSHGGPATQEALVGRATALGRLGRSLEEAAAWNQLLTQFPRSVYVDQAQRRLRELR